MVRLESDLRQARQAGDAAENRVTAAQKDLRAMAALEDEARRLRSQLQAADKRRARDSKALKDTEARAAAVETRLAERNSHLESLQQQLSAVRLCHCSRRGPCVRMLCFLFTRGGFFATVGTLRSGSLA